MIKNHAKDRNLERYLENCGHHHCHHSQCAGCAGDAAAVKPLNQTCSKPVYRLAASWFFLEHKHSINIK